MLCPFAIAALRNYQALTASPYGLNCTSCPRQRRCDNWGTEETGYRHEGARLFGKDWEICPTATLNTPHVAIGLSLYNASQVSSLAGWPHEWSAWVVEYVTQIHDTLEACKRAAINE